MLLPLPPQRKDSIEVGNRVGRRDSGGRGSWHGPLEHLRPGRPHAARQLAIPDLAASRGRGQGGALGYLANGVAWPIKEAQMLILFHSFSWRCAWP